jgi:hypothetical protein
MDIVPPDARGCTGDFSKKKYFQKLFSWCKLVDMVCCMKSHQGRFQKSHFLVFYVRFLVFFLVLLEKMRFLDGFLLFSLLFSHLCGF